MLQQLKKNKYQILCILLLVLLVISIGFHFSKGSNATCSIEEKTCIDTITLKENKMRLQPGDVFEHINLTDISIHNDILEANAEIEVKSSFLALNELDIFHTEYSFVVTFDESSQGISNPQNNRYDIPPLDFKTTDIKIKAKISDELKYDLAHSDESFFSIALVFTSDSDPDTTHIYNFILAKSEIKMD